MRPILIIGALAGVALIAVAAGGSASQGTKTAVVKNRFGYYIPYLPGRDRWVDVHGPAPTNNPAALAARRATLPSDAYGSQDKYSKEQYPKGDGFMLDEYGRHPAGIPGNALETLAGVAQMALPYIPGIGTAAAAGLGAAIALGQGKSLQDAALAAGYYAVPPHLRFAYAAGVGVASGQSIESVAISAADAQYPGARQAYEKGKALAS